LSPWLEAFALLLQRTLAEGTPLAARRRPGRKIKHATTEKLTIRGEHEKDLIREIPLNGPRLLLGQAHGGDALSVGRIELAMELIHGTNQLVPLPSQPLERLGICKHLGSGTGRFVVGRSELLCQL
jgi:hypothetical protein